MLIFKAHLETKTECIIAINLVQWLFTLEGTIKITFPWSEIWFWTSQLEFLLYQAVDFCLNFATGYAEFQLLAYNIMQHNFIISHFLISSFGADGAYKCGWNFIWKFYSTEPFLFKNKRVKPCEYIRKYIRKFRL